MFGMAAKRIVKKVKQEVFTPEPVETIEHLAVSSKKMGKTMAIFKSKVFWGALVVLLLLFGFWYKTNSWPIVAVAGMKPITRFEMNQELFKQYGKDALENRITELLVRNELDRTGVVATADEVSKKVNEIKTSLGTDQDLGTLLAERGMTQAQFEDQLKLQIRVEKALVSKVNITDEEVASYLKTNAQYITATGEAATTQARESLKYGKLQEEVSKWIEELKAKAKVWRAPGV